MKLKFPTQIAGCQKISLQQLTEEIRLLPRSAILKVWSEYLKGFRDSFWEEEGGTEKSTLIIILSYYLSFLLSFFHESSVKFLQKVNRLSEEADMRIQVYLSSQKLKKFTKMQKKASQF